MKNTPLKRLLALAFSILLSLSLFSCSLTTSTDSSASNSMYEEQSKGLSNDSSVDEEETTNRYSTGLETVNLSESLKAATVTGKEIDELFTENVANFSIDLFKQCVTEDKNTLVSPTSVLYALAMTANGADGQTLEQMEEVLAGGIPIDDLNKYLYTYSNNLPSKENSKLNIANSIWFRNNLDVENDFLQNNMNYYNAPAYATPFDKTTLEEINNWTNDNTDGMIDKIIEDIPSSVVMYLLNAVIFDAQWDIPYKESDVKSADFTKQDGTIVSVDMMYSSESKYIEAQNAMGFIKPYVNGDYAFVALLPDEGISVTEYADSLTGEEFINLINSAKNESVNAGLPKFENKCSYKLKDILKNMGMQNAFSGAADFSRISKSSSLNISEVHHKTAITVNEKGTKAAAVTGVAMQESVPKEIILDRPFVYSIIDTKTNLPIFIGVMANPE